MSNISLPVRPSLKQLKKRAKELLGAVRNNDPDAVALFAQHHRADDVTLCSELPMRYVHLARAAAGLECKF
jgi:hypothetical protein